MTYCSTTNLGVSLGRQASESAFMVVTLADYSRADWLTAIVRTRPSLVDFDD